MQAQLAGVDRRKEVLPQTANERQACQAEKEKTSREELPVIQTQLQQVRVASPYCIETALEAVMNARENACLCLLFGVLAALLVSGGFLLHQVHDQRRHQGAGKEV